MADDAPGFFRSLRGLATDWVQTKRKNLQAKPQTQVGSAGGIGQYEFGGQEIDQQELKDVKAMRESGGIISQVYHSKALIKFGTGAELQAEDDDLQQVLNEELFSDLESLVLDIGEDAIWYPYSVGEIVETRTGDFSHIELIEPWTMLPQTDEYGDIIAWEQKISGHTAEAFDPDEIGHVIINKASGRDKTGISEVLRSKEEIETFKSNQNAMREATERLGFPFIHAQAGREGATQLNDNELRRIRNRLAEIGPGETQVTGPDVDIEQMEPATVDFGEIQTRDMKMLATASGLPIELLNEGSDGLGSGMPAELRKELLALRNEADRRKIADQFVNEFVKPVVREYTEFDHTQDITMQVEPFLDDKQDMASLIQSVGGYLTADEARDMIGKAPLDDEELGESFVTPEDEQSDEPEGGGGLFGSDGRDTDFRRLQQEGFAIQDPDECDGQVIEGPQGGLRCIPADGSGDDTGGLEGDITEDEAQEAIQNAVESVDTTETVESDAGHAKLSKEQQEKFRETLSEEIGEEHVNEFYENLGSWKGSSYSDTAQTHEKAFAEAFNLDGDIRNGELDGDDTTREQVAVARAFGELSQEFVKENFGGEVELHRGLADFGMGQLVANWANDPAAEEIEFNLSAMSNFSKNDAVAESFGDDTAVIDHTISSEDVMAATDFISERGGVDESEISIDGGGKSIDPAEVNVYGSKDYLPLDPVDTKSRTAERMAETINNQAENMVGVLDDTGKQTIQEFQDEWGLLDESAVDTLLD